MFADKATLNRWGGEGGLVEEAGKKEVETFRFKGWNFASFHTKMVDSATLDALQNELCGDVEAYNMHIPPMVFGHDVMRIRHTGSAAGAGGAEEEGVGGGGGGGSAYSLNFNAKDALQCWAKQHEPARVAAEPLHVVQVPYSRTWLERSQFATTSSNGGAAAREAAEVKDSESDASISIDDSVTHRAWDWTFSTDYCGTLAGGALALHGLRTASVFDDVLMAAGTGVGGNRFRPSATSGIDFSALRATSDPILFYDELLLYQDDLEDCGEVSFDTKLRVMPNCWFVLARLFLRIDGVMVRLRESRYFHSFGSPQVHLEVTVKECATSVGADIPYDIPRREVDPTLLRDANRLSQAVPVVSQHFFAMDL